MSVYCSLFFSLGTFVGSRQLLLACTVPALLVQLLQQPQTRLSCCCYVVLLCAFHIRCIHSFVCVGCVLAVVSCWLWLIKSCVLQLVTCRLCVA